MFSTKQFRPFKKTINSIVLINRGDGSCPVNFKENFLRVFHSKRYRTMDRKKSSFVQSVELTQPLGNVDKITNCIFLRCATSDEIDYTIHVEDITSVQNNFETEELYFTIYFDTVTYYVHPNMPWGQISELNRSLNSFHVQRNGLTVIFCTRKYNRSNLYQLIVNKMTKIKTQLNMVV